MAVIPRYDEAKVAPNDLPTPRMSGASPMGDAMGNFAQQLGGISREAQQQAVEVKTKADASAVMEAQASLNSKILGLQTKAMQRQGKDALDNKPFYEEFENIYKEHQGLLKNDDQRFLFQRQTANDPVQFQLVLERHASEQGRKVNVLNANALVDTDKQKLSILYKDTEAFEQQLKVAQAHALDALHMQGIPDTDPAAANALAKLKSDAYTDRVKQMMTDDPTKASGYFEGVSQHIEPKERESLKSTLASLTTKQQGMDVALELGGSFSGASSTSDLWAARDKALTEARTRLKGNAVSLNIAETQIRQMASEREQGIKIAQAEAVKPVYAVMAKAREAGRIPSLSEIPDADWVRLQQTDPEKANEIIKGIDNETRLAADRAQAKIEHAANLREREENRRERREMRAEREQERKEKQAQRRNFADLWSDPDSLQKADINGMVASGALSPDQAQHLDNRRKIGNQDTLFTETQELNRIIGAAKVKPKSEQFDQVIDYVARRKAAFVAEEKRQPKTSEVADFAREALYKVDADWNPFDKPAYKVAISDVPKADVQAITAARRQRGLPTSDFDIISTYARKQRKGGK